MYGLDLFSGIGGLSEALREWVRPVAYCERDSYAAGVLLSRMADGSIPYAPVWDDIRTLRGRNLPPVNIIFGGFPCQDISVAGRGKGLAGERSGLFFEIVRLATEIHPTFVFLENVPAIRTRGLDAVVGEFSRLGYDCRWTMLSAAQVGADHKRERWFLLAHTKRRQSERDVRFPRGDRCVAVEARTDNLVGPSLISAPVADPTCPRLPGTVLYGEPSGRGNAADASWWAVEPNVGRVANGIPQRVDRLRCLGNAVVPLQAKTAFEILLGVQ